MARVEFQASLDSLEASLQEQGAVVLRALRGAVNVLHSQDAELCDEVVAFDDEIDSRYHRIEKSVEELLAQQSPVATDLRLVLAILHDSIHLERIGDQCVTIAKLTKLASRARAAPRPRRRPDARWASAPRRWCGSRSTRSRRATSSAPASLVELDELIDRTNRRVVGPGAHDGEHARDTGVGDADDRRLTLHRADRRQRRRHRRADRLPRHRRVPRVHRRVALTTVVHQFVNRNRHRISAHPTQPAGEARVARAARRNDTNGNQGRGSNHEESSWAHARRGQRGRDRSRRRRRDRGAGASSRTRRSAGRAATFVFPLVSKWIPALGSAYGIQRHRTRRSARAAASRPITARTVDFGASDAPLSAPIS